MNIYSEVYDGSTGLGGGYHIYAKIKCGKCSCSLDPVDLYTNIYDLRNEPDELVSNYAQKWNTRYSDFSCEHRAPGELYYKSGIKFKEGRFCDNNTEITKLPVQEFGQVIITDKLTDKQREEIKKRV